MSLNFILAGDAMHVHDESDEQVVTINVINSTKWNLTLVKRFTQDLLRD